MADAVASKAIERKLMGVQVPSPAPFSMIIFQINPALSTELSPYQYAALYSLRNIPAPKP